MGRCGRALLCAFLTTACGARTGPWLDDHDGAGGASFGGRPGKDGSGGMMPSSGGSVAASGGSAGSASGAAGFAGAGGQIEPLRVVALGLGVLHSCALLSNGEARCFGSAGYGVLGYGNSMSIGDDETPKSAGSVPIGAPAEALTGGQDHTCALIAGGAVRCWGYGGFGTLGYGNTAWIGDDEPASFMGDVSIGARATAVVAGGFHTCALLESGGIRCWGNGRNGALGYASKDNVGDDELPSSASEVDVGGPVAQLAAGYQHTCALLTTGTVRCWGNGFDGRLGYGNSDDIGDDELPSSAGDVDVGGPVAQLVCGYSHTCALLESGSVRCWGTGSTLGYGNTTSIGDDELPSSAGDVDLGGPVLDLASGPGAFFTCARLTGGRLRCWGNEFDGQLGYGNTNKVGDDETPASAGDVPVGDPVKALAIAGSHACALLENDSVRCWGKNHVGQLGYANTNNVGDDETPSSVGQVEIF